MKPSLLERSKWTPSLALHINWTRGFSAEKLYTRYPILFCFSSLFHNSSIYFCLYVYRRTTKIGYGWDCSPILLLQKTCYNISHVMCPKKRFAARAEGVLQAFSKRRVKLHFMQASVGRIISSFVFTHPPEDRKWKTKKQNSAPLWGDKLLGISVNLSPKPECN